MKEIRNKHQRRTEPFLYGAFDLFFRYYAVVSQFQPGLLILEFLIR